jgi:hypothetical protein
MDDIREPQSAAENEALNEELEKTLEDVRAFLDDPVALLERAAHLLRDGAAEAR